MPATLAVLFAVTGGCAESERGGRTAPAERGATATTGRDDAEPTGKILFACGEPDRPANLCVIAPDGSDLRPVTSSGNNTAGSWSPDGNNIVFGRFDTRTNAVQIYTMRADGGGLTRMTASPGHKIQPRWSPDATKIAFVGQGRGPDADIYVMDADGSSRPTNLTRHLADDLDPAWSPDGSHLAFTRATDESARVYLMDADGSDSSPLGPEHGLTPAWSPDGSKIVFSTGGGLELFDLDTAGTETLTREQFDTEPSWSPDGRYVVFRRGEANEGDIYVVSADGDDVRVVSESSLSETSPEWSPK